MIERNIAFCTTCKGRTQHLKETLPKNLSDNACYKNLKFIVLNYGSTDDLMDYLKNYHAVDIASGRIVVYSSEQKVFRMAHAKNMAHRLGIIEGCEILVNIDADNFTGPHFASYINNSLEANSDSAFLWANMKRGVMSRGIYGRIVVSAKAFINVGGYDERFADWGRDDKDFNERLRRLGYAAYEIDESYLLGIRHNDRMRFKEYPHAATKLDENSQGDDSDTTVVNFGRIGCGTVTRNFDPTPIAINPVPTRIFGIGMHKTGTTSLNRALETLGFDSAHWKNAHWAKAIWLEMKVLNRSLTLEQNYALCDLPITVMFKELDQAYPGSKFILTTRDEISWLRSASNHWARPTNKYRVLWDTDPFTHFIHKEIYGRKTFDALTFLERFRRHNNEVLDYFQNRPDDLLVMDVEEANWGSLCAFLNKPVPTMPYPKINVEGAEETA